MLHRLQTAPTTLRLAFALHQRTTMSSVSGKDGKEIHVGDHVWTPFRGGTREGDVQAVYTDSTTKPEEGSAKDVKVDVKNPPKVVFTNQRGKQVSHNPGTLAHKEKEEE